MAADATLLVVTGDGRRRTVNLGDFLDGTAIERAETDAIAWIKSLRHARIDGVALRDRFNHRGDSLWWFAELYLHKGRVIVDLHRAILAVEALVAAVRPVSISVVGGDRVDRHVVPRVAGREGVGCRSRAAHARALVARAAIGTRSALYALSAAADRLRPSARPLSSPVPGRVAGFVHSAFWRVEEGEETYIGPVLREVASRVGPDRLALVGLGPRTNFRRRRWIDRVSEFGDPLARGIPLTPVQAFASWRDTRAALAWWLQRRAVRRALVSSDDLRHAAIIRGCDCWPLVRDELTGISHLQFPWSVRAMEEAGAALDALAPSVVATYAEAGGYGRALVLEARRRRIPSVGLQHGFIYRHWLNYLHEPDEVAPSPRNPDDRGFPRPDLTVVYDRFTAGHLERSGHFPAAAIAVAGSPRLDAFAATARAMTEADRARIRAELGAAPGQHVVVVATKYTQMAAAFRALAAAVAGMRGVKLVVKCHPAETAAPYEAAAAGLAGITIAPGHADLASLVGVARALVTVNSTAALEAMVLEVPSLVVALPNNLSPLVEAGVLAGAPRLDDIGPALTALLDDEGYRAALASRRRAFVEEYGLAADGGAAARAADEIVRLRPQGRST